MIKIKDGSKLKFDFSRVFKTMVKTTTKSLHDLSTSTSKYEEDRTNKLTARVNNEYRITAIV